MATSIAGDGWAVDTFYGCLKRSCFDGLKVERSIRRRGRFSDFSMCMQVGLPVSSTERVCWLVSRPLYMPVGLPTLPQLMNHDMSSCSRHFPICKYCAPHHNMKGIEIRLPSNLRIISDPASRTIRSVGVCIVLKYHVRDLQEFGWGIFKCVFFKQG